MPSIRVPRRSFVFLMALACAVTVLRAQQAPFPFKDPALPLDSRIDDLVARMTLEEKAG
jgi:beta-glucosidase